MTLRTTALATAIALLLATTPAWGMRIFTVAGSGTNAASGDNGVAIAAGLMQPVDMGTDGYGNLYVLDAAARRVRRIGVDNTIRTAATLPSAGISLAVVPDGTLYVALSGEVRRITPAGATTTWKVTAEGMDLDSDGDLLVADPAHHVVRRLTPGGTWSVAAGREGIAGTCVDGESATDACLSAPHDVAADSQGNLYIADAGNHMVWKAAHGTIARDVQGAGDTFAPSRVAVSRDKDGNMMGVFCVDDSQGHARVYWIIESASGLFEGAGTGTPGYGGDGGDSSFAQLNGVDGLFGLGGAGGQLLIADAGNHRVRSMRLNPSYNSRGFDWDNDGWHDVFWHNRSTGQNVSWAKGDATHARAYATVPNTSWEIAGGGYFPELGLVWHNRTTGDSVIWPSVDATRQQTLTSVINTQWRIAGIGEFDGDTLARDLLWRNDQTGANVIWRGGNAYSTLTVSGAVAPWQLAGIGDFDGDGVSDLLWRNPTTGDDVVWRSARSNTALTLTKITGTWQIAGVGDFDGDGRSDIFWRNTTTGQNVIWRAGDARMPMAADTTATAWSAASIADYDGDGTDDVLWRNTKTGANVMWFYNGPLPQARTLASAPLQWVPVP